MGERARVLITVKASPEPSRSYGDTVCVAGVLLNDDHVQWVRIYPVAFRHLASDQQFRKYEVIEVELSPSPRDSRRESRRPVWESLVRGGRPLPMGQRNAVLQSLIGPTMCELRAGVVAELTAPSLGLVQVRALDPLKFEDHGPWSARQVQDMKNVMSQPDLLGTTYDAPLLVPPRFKVKYRYLCMASECGGHEQRILDWELNALQYHQRQLSDGDLRQAITTKFLDEIWNDSVRTYFYVGNFADVVKRKSFSVLGVYRPRRVLAGAVPLF